MGTVVSVRSSRLLKLIAQFYTLDTSWITSKKWGGSSLGLTRQRRLFVPNLMLESVLKHSLFLSYCFIFFDKLIVCNKLCIFLVRYFV